MAIAIKANPSTSAEAMQTPAGPGFIGRSRASIAVRVVPTKAMIARYMQLV